MVETLLSTSAIDSRQVIHECVASARHNGVGIFKGDRRSMPRAPFAHPVRYCVGSVPTEGDTQPGYTLDISLEGMSLCCQQGLPVGAQIWVRLPLPNGKRTWLNGTIVHCEPDEEHYRAGIAFSG